jgi:hypothetical protein
MLVLVGIRAEGENGETGLSHSISPLNTIQLFKDVKYIGYPTIYP